MFESDKFDRSLMRDRSAVPAGSYEAQSQPKEISLLFWTEHCVECAAPSCYSTCDLYEPRADARCRRFAFGALKNKTFPSFRGYGVEISFKKWAKIETFGNYVMAPARTVMRYEKVLSLCAPLVNFFGKLLGRLTGNSNWDSATYLAIQRLVRHFASKHKDQHMPEAFLIEVYNPADETARMQLSFAPIVEDGPTGKNLVQLGPSFVTTLSLPNGYSRHNIDGTFLRPVLSPGKPFKISMTPEADNNARLVFLSADFVNLPAKVGTPETKNIKCLVWDLDNTLWQGTLVEGDDVHLRPGVVTLLKQLDERGILLSIASKNDHASAWQKLEQFGIHDYFLYPQIGWGPKSSGIKAIAQKLNIGIDALAFVDDNPFELDEVKRSVPEVLCIPATDIGSLSSDSRFKGSSSAEARRRRQFYREAISREQAQQEFGADYFGFLASCGIRLDVEPYSEESLGRIIELVQRTNQLNFSGRKYTRVQLNEILADHGFEKYVLKCSDRYGSYGTVGFSIVQRGSGLLQIRDFMLSCRVQGKFIEQAFFHHLVEHHNRDVGTRIWVNFCETARNKPAKHVLETLGFQKCDSLSGGMSDGMLCSSPDALTCDFIKVHCSMPAVETVQFISNGR